MDVYRLVNSNRKYLLSKINPSSTDIFSIFISDNDIEVVEYECKENQYTHKHKDMILIDCDKYEARLNGRFLNVKGKVLLPLCNMQFVKPTFNNKEENKDDIQYTAYTIRNDIRHDLKLHHLIETNELLVGGGRIVRFK